MSIPGMKNVIWGNGNYAASVHEDSAAAYAEAVGGYVEGDEPETVEEPAQEPETDTEPPTKPGKPTPRKTNDPFKGDTLT